MKILLEIERAYVEERELDFDETNMNLNSLIEDIKEWYKGNVFNEKNSVLSGVHGTLIDKETNEKLVDFNIK